MNRVSIIQGIIDKTRAKYYLEIGVQCGDTFFRIKARNKIAVDPHFLITPMTKFNWLRWNISNIFNTYYEMPSDSFFDKKANSLKKNGLDVVFVDGLHTYEQSFQDIENSLAYLNDGGVIVIDDCNPPSEKAANPVKEDDNEAWTGDVWKSIVRLRSTRPDLSVFVLDCVFGLGVVIKRPPDSMLEYSADDVKNMTYSDIDNHRSHYLNVKEPKYFEEFLDSL